jgi:serine/threonine protein kinase
MPLIGDGNYGCVFRPHVKCKDKSKKHANAVSKVFVDVSDYDSELSIARKVESEIDPSHDFTLPLLNSCRVSLTTTDKPESCGLIKGDYHTKDFQQLIYKYGGKSLKDILKTKGTIKKLVRILAGFKPVLQGIERIGKAGYVHQDIKPHNLLNKGSKIFLIDFGIMSRMDNIFAPHNKHVLGYDYPYYPPEYKLYVHSRSLNTFFIKVMQNYHFNFEINGKNVDMLAEMSRIGIDYRKELTEVFGLKKGCFLPNKIDTFSIGFVILELFIWSGLSNKIMKNNTATKRLRTELEVFLRGVLCFNSIQRFTISQALEQFDKVLVEVRCISSRTQK